MVEQHRSQTLTAALGFPQLTSRAPELRLMHRWIDSWRGIGDIGGGMRRLGYATEFRQYPQGWRVNVRRASGDPVVGSGWATRPWQAVQTAAWAAVKG